MRLPQLSSDASLMAWAHLLVQALEVAIKPVSTGSGVLSAGTTTVVSNSGCRAGSAVFLSPNSPSAIAASPYVAATADGSFTLMHAAGGGAFTYVIL